MDLKEIKHQFFTYRNGITADALRNAGMPYGIIFGLDVPTLAAISRSVEHSEQLAEALWADKDVRESRLLATYIFDPASISMERAIELASQTQTQEEADMLAFRLFKRLPFAGELLTRLGEQENCRRAAKALAAHLT